jgi:hypothetical protein
MKRFVRAELNRALTSQRAAITDMLRVYGLSLE